MQSVFRPLVAVAAFIACIQPGAAQSVRWLTQTQQQQAQYPVEIAAIDKAKAGGLAVERNEFQVLGLNLADALRLAGSGTFQIVSTQVGSVARDDAFLEGIDLIGVATDMTELKGAVDAYRKAFNERLGKRFGVKALALWPFGPQVFFCNQEIKSLADMKGLKVRSFTASMSTLLGQLGATPVTLSFPEVYPALQRGVASCGVTSPTSANTGKWPEVTKFVLPLSVSGSVQAHLVNLAWYEKLPATQKAALDGSMAEMETALWTLATKSNDDALACTVGDAKCPGGIYNKYENKLAPVSDADKALVKKISEEKILPEWAARCKTAYPECATVWSDTIGKARGLSIK
ncbi:TRAP transporter substrate-binding protein [Bosea sp. (in: a-proteobacteria)]|jgi:TRAP-type C4-dicarboxylate transport system substrate-binding protein|uniref:TRAP transporter substrate-binding protein n=1 Tax=Bosea sp. (in: a-proteobacteria) TaxID=1871050 RepID=UPI003563848A